MMKKMMLSSVAAALALATASAGASAAFAQPGPGGWDLGRREAWLQQRIDRGVADGSLTRPEARRVQRQLVRIRMEERRMRRMDGGGLRPADRDRLQARLDNVSDHIRWARHNDDRRPW
jgi:hypothetical protein